VKEEKNEEKKRKKEKNYCYEVCIGYL